MKGYFVTGTDTNVGKTVLSTVLTLGLNATYWKPIQTGTVEGTDSDFVRRWGGKTLPETYCFPDPLSPHLAAENADVEIALEKCREFTSPLVVEGAGGVLVPLNSRHLLIDLIRQLRLPTLVVASTRLGTINHSLLTLEALRAREIAVAGFVTCGEENEKVRQSISYYGEARSLGHIPFCPGFHRGWFQEAFQQLTLPMAAPAASAQEESCPIP
jgi:dethiobiotin synthetase